MANANKWYDIYPLQAAGAAMGTHAANVLIAINPGDRTRIRWMGAEGALDADITDLTIALFSGAVRHAPYGDPADETPLTGIGGSEARVDGPGNITLTSGWSEEFECIGSQPALLLIPGYLDEGGLVAGTDPDAEE